MPIIKKKISKTEIRSLVVERLKTLSSGRRISIGADGDFSKEELINHVEKGDKIGDKIIKVQINYLQSLKKGILPND